METKSRLVVARDSEKQGVTAKGHRVSFWGDDNVLKLDGSHGCTTL